ncbi:hypothetical protein Taro_049589 [Colocasia esculenta]|uniref:Uncharacterized protein n=1 Tax=Colocasia esculenta TaxID=4460 RepID=A0A843XBI2_COLES|nr:hypothetical protein [Colocasia esculenta]
MCQAWVCSVCCCKCGVGWSPQLVGTIKVERQLELSSVATRLRGSHVWFVRVNCWCREPDFVAQV